MSAILVREVRGVASSPDSRGSAGTGRPCAAPSGGLDRASLRARLQATLGSRARRVVEPDGRVSAAVLVLFVYRGVEPGLVFSKRTETVPHHKGQFAFPGGVVQAGDLSRVDTALREAEEEVGLDRAAVDVLGLFDDTPTNATPFVITPVVAIHRGEPAFRPDGREIERVVEIPLRHLLDPACFREEWWERDGRPHPVAFFTRGEDVVWGATARILRTLFDTVFPDLARGAG
jgi:8-oxo-dGTP pyrophosphatase MutT (NUDIX family)